MPYHPLSNLIRHGLTRVLPLRCLVCYRSLRYSEICYRCRPTPHMRIERQERCFRCFSTSPSACSLCPSFPLPCSTLQAVYHYQGIVRDLILAMKFNPSRRLVDYCGQVMRSHLHIPPNSVVVAIPSARQSAITKLFTPSVRMAWALRDAARGIECAPQVLRVTNPGRPRQATIDAPRDRLRAVHLAFAVNPRAVQGKSVVVVDDIVTTGATVMASTKALLDAGALEVHIRALAISPRWEESRELLHRYFPGKHASRV
jgi:predicted amidophosphoribosyltransferase